MPALSVDSLYVDYLYQIISDSQDFEQVRQTVANANPLLSDTDLDSFISKARAAWLQEQKTIEARVLAEREVTLAQTQSSVSRLLTAAQTLPAPAKLAAVTREEKQSILRALASAQSRDAEEDHSMDDANIAHNSNRARVAERRKEDLEHRLEETRQQKQQSKKAEKEGKREREEKKHARQQKAGGKS